jgi:glutaredoxin-related protein
MKHFMRCIAVQKECLKKKREKPVYQEENKYDYHFFNIMQAKKNLINWMVLNYLT